MFLLSTNKDTFNIDNPYIEKKIEVSIKDEVIGTMTIKEIHDNTIMFEAEDCLFQPLYKNAVFNHKESDLVIPKEWTHEFV